MRRQRERARGDPPIAHQPIGAFFPMLGWSEGEARQLREGSPVERGVAESELGSNATSPPTAEPKRVGPVGGPAHPGQRVAAAPAQLGAEWVVGVAEYAEEKVLRRDVGVAVVGGVIGGEVQGPFGEQVDAQGAGPWMATAPPWSTTDAPLGGVHRVAAERGLQPATHLVEVDPHRTQRRGGISVRADGGPDGEQLGPGRRKVQPLFG